MWKFMAAVDGYIRANSTDDGKGLSTAEVDEFLIGLRLTDVISTESIKGTEISVAMAPATITA